MIYLKTKLIVLFFVAIYAYVILRALHKRNIKDEFAFLWLVFLASIVALTFMNNNVILMMVRFIGAQNPSSFFFFFGILFMVSISIYFSIKISIIMDKLKKMNQFVSIMTAEVKKQEAGKTDKEDTKQ